MINIIDNKIKGEFIGIESVDPFWCKILSRYMAYGYKVDYINFWVQRNINKNITAAILKMDSTGIGFFCDNADFVEIKEFLISIGISLFTFNRKYLDKLGLSEIKFGKVMKFSKLNFQSSIELPICVPQIKELLSFIMENFNYSFNNDNFEKIYVDISHRIRHNAARAIVLKDKGKIVSAAMTVDETNNIAVIGGVSTLAEFRARGFGSYIVHNLVDNLIEENKQIYVFRDENRNKSFYNKLGFYDYCQWSEATVIGN